MNRDKQWETAVLVVVLSLSLGLRLVGLNRFIVPDEVRWTCRSINFQQALSRGDWKNTFRTGHPGVITTWLGSLFINDDDTRIRTMCEDTLDGRKVVWAGETLEDRTHLMQQLGQLLFDARVGVALFTWTCVVGIYFLTRHLWGAKVALLSLILISLDPFFLALSRFIHVDAVLAGLMTISVLGLIASTREASSEHVRVALLVLSGIATGLAILQKSPAMFLGPFAVLVLGLDVLRKGFSRKLIFKAARNLVLWGLIAVAVYVAMWPSLWVDPVGTLRRVLDKALGYAEMGHGSGNYFMGRPDDDPGWLFYPVATAFRLGPLALLGLVVAMIWVVRSRDDAERRIGAAVLLAFALSFWVFMSLGDKMFDRYFLPVYPSLEIVAAVGLLWAVGVVRDRRQAKPGGLRPSLLIYGFALAVQLGIALPHYPYYLTYYNPLLGGMDQAVKILLVGWGEGYDQAAAYLNAKPDAEELQVATSNFPSFSPQFLGKAQSIENYSPWETDYVMFYLSHVQRLHNRDLLSEYLFDTDVQPEQVVTLHGVDYVWLYRNDQYLEPMRFVKENRQPSEEACILVNGGSLFAKHYDGDLPLVTFHSLWDRREEYYIYPLAAEVARQFEKQAPQCKEVWYVRYPETEKSWYTDLLQNRGVLQSSVSFRHVELSLYRVVIDDVARESIDYRFGDLQLLSFGITDPPPTWGKDGGVALEWKASASMDDDYSVFLHVYDTQGHRVAQQDTLILDEKARPTSEWGLGQASVGVYHLPIAPGTPPGEYELEVGVYFWRTGGKLPLEGAKDGRLPVQVGVPDQPRHAAELRIPHWVEQEVTPELRLLGYDVGEESLVAGGAIYLRLFWEVVEEMDQAFRLQLGLRGGDGILYDAKELALVNTDYPTNRWRKGELLQERYYLPTSEALSTGETLVELDLLDEAGHSVLSNPLAVTEVWVQSTRPSFELSTCIPVSCEAELGDRVKLLGYELESSARPGGDVEVTVCWQALTEIQESYKAFVHLYNEAGVIVSQQDRPPGLGARPTEVWEAGEVVAARYRIPIERRVLPGDYQVAVGLYREETGERLVALGPDGERLNQDRIVLGSVTIGP